MSTRNSKNSPEDKSEEFVAVVYARSLEEAEQYRELLDDHDIPAMFGTNASEDEEGKLTRRAPVRTSSRGIPIMVPEVMLNEASEVIASREELEDFATEDDEFEDDDEEEGEDEASESDDEELEEEDEESFEDEEDEFLEDDKE